MATLNVSERTAKMLQDLAAARGVGLDEMLADLLLQIKDPIERQRVGIQMLAGLVDIPDTDLAENDEKILHELFEKHDDSD